MDNSDPPTGKIDLSTFLVYMAREYRDLGMEKSKIIEKAFSKSFHHHKSERVPVVAFRSTLTNSGERLTDDEVDEVVRKSNSMKNSNETEVDIRNVVNTLKCKDEKILKSSKWS
mmetsp:Transcript_17434/g.17527  ORF Transcript_17434/g.17527 Transcript_17434/m.17527 type:complete len:114 (+) Transcript_17434:473-814(+)